jgi:toxin ParE1/3/4
MKVSYEPPALDELKQAVIYYKQDAELTGQAFVSDFDATIARIIEYPKAWPPTGRDVRRCLFGRFPYQVVYRIENDAIRVYAIAHLKREPTYWHRRIRRKP